MSKKKIKIKKILRQKYTNTEAKVFQYLLDHKTPEEISLLLSDKYSLEQTLKLISKVRNIADSTNREQG